MKMKRHVMKTLKKKKTLEGDKIQKKQTKKLMKQDETVLKRIEKKTTQERRQSPRFQKTKTKKSMKQDKSVFKHLKRKQLKEKKTNEAEIKIKILKTKTLKVVKEKKAKVPINPNDRVSLRTRMSPKKFYDIVKSLNKEQKKKTVREMRLGSLLRIATNGISGKLARFIVNSFNPSDMKMHLPNAKIDVTPTLVHDLLRIPLGGKDIYNTDQYEGKELMDWKQQYNFKAMRPSDLEERIKESSDSGIIFRTNFLLLFVNTICEQNKPGTCKTTVLPHLLGKTPMREIDWCGFITNCLKMSKTTWDETDRGNYYCGPLLVLLLAYLEFMRNDKNEKRQIHALHFWDYDMMLKREKVDLKSGDFGTLEWNDDVIENNEESDTDENEDMKLDELVFKAKKNYKKLVNDKIEVKMKMKQM
ncbi:unnamed protein product [Lactuca virosa]|uniref:Ubiquitin-like protease family profile domain-containing protein n=1 Tax=Lactuca virosa TaxID=75947 RepID=A0AAU9LX10_9ASTR|nr:unnamed protein product [Lactuca virosa]